MTTNISEAINGVFKGARRLPITAIVSATFTRSKNAFLEREEGVLNLQQKNQRWPDHVLNKFNKDQERERERQLFGPSEDDLLGLQHTHRSRLIYITRDHNDTLLQLMQGSQNIFWTTRAELDDDDFILHPRVLDRLEVMGFYGPARCGYHKLDRILSLH
ncbi:hypothetical protein ACS0TY_032337 [Phlomoides rotata]